MLGVGTHSGIDEASLLFGILPPPPTPILIRQHGRDGWWQRNALEHRTVQAFKGGQGEVYLYLRGSAHIAAIRVEAVGSLAGQNT